MGFFENSADTARAVFESAQKKTGKAVDISKKKLEEKKLEGRISALYEALGENYYRSTKEDVVSDGRFEKIIADIDAASAQLLNVRAEIESLKFSKVCPQCGAGVKKGSEYCGKCGARV